MNLRGGYKELDSLDFVYGSGTTFIQSCMVQWRNQDYIFGGADEAFQVSMINGNRLERKGSLNFGFQFGGCAVLNEETIIMCFGDAPHYNCQMLSHPLDSSYNTTKSYYEHAQARISGMNGTNANYSKKKLNI